LAINNNNNLNTPPNDPLIAPIVPPHHNLQVDIDDSNLVIVDCSEEDRSKSSVIVFEGNDRHGIQQIDAIHVTCTFSLDSMQEVIEQRRNQGRNAIIAQVPTRDNNDVTRNSYDYYEAVPFLRLLFHRQGGIVSHRYNEKYPLVVRNPLTNSPIVGEVAFYIITDNDCKEGNNGKVYYAQFI